MKLVIVPTIGPPRHTPPPPHEVSEEQRGVVPGCRFRGKSLFGPLMAAHVNPDAVLLKAVVHEEALGGEAARPRTAHNVVRAGCSGAMDLSLPDPAGSLPQHRASSTIPRTDALPRVRESTRPSECAGVCCSELSDSWDVYTIPP